MDLSHSTYASPKPKRYVGLGLVVALHVAGICALSAGLVRVAPEPPRLITMKPLPPEVTPEPPKPEPRPVDRPVMKEIEPIRVPLPADPVIAPDPVVTTQVIQDSRPATPPTGPTHVDTTPSQPAVTQRVQTPGAVCSVMPAPDMPALSWSGEAVLQVVATVRSGRVVGTDIRVTQGAPDSKTRRSLQRAVEAALSGYQCQGDALFQQDFAFRVD
ncbi:hypothetical protein [Roseateles sp. BYS96W]|uniref:TonB C-terminal domain-containing protein n=1 Tax=Pelomonas nitida TaxID=3299027 RepID=A0ABW7G363_9BURK